MNGHRDPITGQYVDPVQLPATSREPGKIYEMDEDDQILNRLMELEHMAENAVYSRRRLAYQMSNYADPRRNINHECGYPETQTLTPELYKDRYDRDPIGARVVEVLPKECWKVTPKVFEDEDPETTTPFEEDLSALADSLREESFFKNEDQGNPVWEYLLRADILSGVGQFGIILLGIDDGAELNTPAQPGEGRRLKYLRVLDQSLVKISRYEEDKNNRRYGQPVEYLVTLTDPKYVRDGGLGLSTATTAVHWSRVIHVADELGSSEILGTPRMQRVWNRLYDLEKMYGGSAEMYWRGAFPGLSFETHPQLGARATFNKTELRDQMEEYMNGLQRYFAVQGITAKSLAPQVSDPSSQIDVLLTAICILTGIPKRVFMGSERGELSSGQDSDTWDDRLTQRHNGYLTPRLLVPFFDRLIQLGVLRPPTEGYRIEWPDLSEMSESEKADVTFKKTDSLVKYVGGSVESLIPPVEYLVDFLGVPEDRAQAYVDSATEAMEEKEAEEELKQAEALEEAERLGLTQPPEQGGPPNGPPQKGTPPGTKPGVEEDREE